MLRFLHLVIETAMTIDRQNRQNLSSPSRILRASAARLACLTRFTSILQVRQAASRIEPVFRNKIKVKLPPAYMDAHFFAKLSIDDIERR